MSDSKLRLTADALAAAINAQNDAGGFDPAVKAVREWSAETKLADLEELQLLVIPVDWSRMRVSRAAWQEFFRVNIGLRKRHQGDAGELAPADKLDPLDDLRAVLIDFVSDAKLTVGTGYATVHEIKSIAAMAREDLARLRVFSSVFEINYRLSL